MWSPRLLGVAAASLTLNQLVYANTIPVFAHHRRGIITPDELSSSYDFVIAGGGVAGLVLAARLSEDSNTTVLVLEAGDTGDAVGNIINPPAATYYTSLVGSSYDWAYETTSQSSAGGQVLPWPRGKVLGGSSAINGMYLVRPSEVEVNAWQNLIAPTDSQAAAAWSWPEFFQATKKVETFTPPTPDVQSAAGIQFNQDSQGTQGPMHASYPGFMIDTVGTWLPSLQAIGIPSNPDAFGGNTLGGFIAQSSINPTNWTRSYSKSAYIDPLPPRQNLHILVNSTVTRFILSSVDGSSNQKASQVEFATDASSDKKTVNVNKEVLLSGGAIGSPQMLMVSGVGPSDVLQAANVPVKVELPGVGQHLQDHLVTGLTWKTTTQTAGDLHASNSDVASSAEFMSFVNSATAYINASYLFGSSDDAANFRSQMQAALTTSVQTLIPSTNSEVIEGYKAIYDVVTNTLLPSDVGQVELLLSLNAPGQIGVQVALQHPFSQGRLFITTASAFDKPTIDPYYLAHSGDVTILRQGLKLARTLGSTPPLSSVLQTELTPGPSVVTDEDWENWLKGQVKTEFHPAGTCAMLPKEKGGVVDANLKVYGLDNVRVVDASVFPINFASHLGSPTFALAEQAASIIRSQYNGLVAPGSNSSVPGPNQDSGNHNGASSLLSSSSSTMGVVMTMAAVLFAVFM
ncbi:GMC oxidoreductase [Pluteus cervinus]|uniref:GMC oxidoreductase n=1 Tax=Pluteus cervinus TaxID=181527 RepID=A0ACD3AKI8_9AGAR|nr:GMC oxidoreductase [Pluteus cervinus]